MTTDGQLTNTLIPLSLSEIKNNSSVQAADVRGENSSSRGGAVATGTGSGSDKQAQSRMNEYAAARSSNVNSTRTNCACTS
eukprot:CAMPEP_0196806614 /NCGR_PEP_ID=MMETSP1362-20130617/6518_1 /TAXON_ID=163516 /ORGANISM="Leptocylindrus danicus, Strain CCMP1856" /LENGTH=80 /DNA_ID=CAMNT_0042180165 /DNA_START=101 /DNA_END=344 /DNA_ORIENTATION=+